MTTENFKIMAISGSLRRDSYNTAVLRAAQEIASNDVSIELADIGHLPFLNTDLKANEMPADVRHLAERVAAADALLIASPEYNHSLPGVLKNAIDWLSLAKPNPLAEKPAAILGVSTGAIGTARMQNHLRQILITQNTYIVNKPLVLVSQAAEKFDDGGRLVDEKTREKIGELIIAVKTLAERLAY